ncbi:cytochrome P450 4F2-like [Piliocolobus tephrosceles]|uniref:cytochrome P450 4F2-like n=1 Tax=Piliocolobus tephrosceles TaxID=591936 RepID=UPI000C2986CE|nr:cytochrome P450 4F2-like [Piliocolobus tephrosceles]
MSQLSLSCLGLGQVAASPWLLLLLIRVSWFLARVLARTCAFYDNCRCLWCFLQPLMQNGFLGHLGLVTPMEELMRVLTQLVATYPQGFKVWMGLISPLIILCHLNIIWSVINTSGTIWNAWWWVLWWI